MSSMILGWAFALFGSSAFAIETVPELDVNRYMGRWYQIAANPMIYQYGCVCSQQTLGRADNGNLTVYNSCNLQKPGGTLSEVRGEARVVDLKSNAKLSVDFGLGRTGEYWVIAIAKDYSWSVVTDSKGESLFILSRTPQMDETIYKDVVRQAAEEVDTHQLKATEQKECVYPAGS
ncbi:MAG: lipocalin family protein [Bdellovibrionales bacterium]|nr:lipocalin family protein [Bdellovibrionales bacterium]